MDEQSGAPRGYIDRHLRLGRIGHCDRCRRVGLGNSKLLLVVPVSLNVLYRSYIKIAKSQAHYAFSLERRPDNGRY